jgi:hypothetical protein
MINRMRTTDTTLEEQRLVCPETWCGSGTWLVQRDAELQNVWQVTNAIDGGNWTVAATDPVCPCCGTTLAMTIELEGQLSTRSGALVGAMRAR